MSKTAKSPQNPTGAQMNKVQKFFSNHLPKLTIASVLIITLLICAWILLIRLNDGLGITSTKLLLISLIVITALVLSLYFGKKQLFKFIKNPKALFITTIIVVILGVILRLLFLRFYHEYMPKGEGTDTGIHWYTAQEILKTGHIDSYIAGTYEAFFTQLTSYTLLVAASMKIFGINYLAILLPNIVFDLIAAGAIYILLKKWQNRQVAWLSVAIFMLNPLGVFFCAEGMALSVVNMFIALAFLAIYYFLISLQQQKYRKVFLFSIIIGLILSCGNAFRPIFSIYIIALVLLLAIYCLQKWNWRHAAKACLSIVMLLITFMLANYAWDGVYRIANPYYQSEKHSMIGWNFFVGSNYDTSGRWSLEDWDIVSPKLYGIEKTSDSGEVSREGAMLPKDLNAEFMQRGWTRYKEMGVRRFLLHFFNKSRILFGKNEITIIRNMEEQFTNVWGVEEWYDNACILSLLTLSFFAVFTFIYFIQTIKTIQQPSANLYAFFLALVFCGFFTSSLLVEVMSRYVVIFIVPFVIFSTCAIGSLINKQQTKLDTNNIHPKSSQRVRNVK